MKEAAEHRQTNGQHGCPRCSLCLAVDMMLYVPASTSPHEWSVTGNNRPDKPLPPKLLWSGCLSQEETPGQGLEFVGIDNKDRLGSVRYEILHYKLDKVVQPP